MSKDVLRETLGFLAVALGLVFVGVEIRENSRAARAAAYQELGLATADLWATLTDHPDLALALGTASADTAFAIPHRAETLSQMVTYQLHAWRVWETAYLQVEEGLLPPEALERFGWGSTLFGNPFEECLWRSPSATAFKSPEFTAYLDSLRPESGVDCAPYQARAEEAIAVWLSER